MPVFDYSCQKCDIEFEDICRYDEIPECPDCHTTEQVSKLLSAPMGVVVLSGQELKASIKQAARNIERKAMTDDNLASNLIGEPRYEDNAKKIDKIKRKFKM